jgi:erythronate-4-phosphate dehydrogenase
MSCPGCNAQAVCNYIEEALNEYQIFKSSNLQISATPVIGVVGVGHVGSLVAQMAERKGMQILLNDPPKGIGVSLDEIARNCDILTFHVPLDKSTYHLCNEAFLDRCKQDALIINAARGGVVDEQALLRSGHPYILDTWENEPDIHQTVLRHAFRASMHIAGYSVQGKHNATQMCLDAIANTFGLPKIILTLPKTTKGDTSPGWLARISDTLKAHPEQFETLRKNYLLR